MPIRPGHLPRALDSTVSQRLVPMSSQGITSSIQVMAEIISLSMSGVMTTGGPFERTSRQVGRPNSTDRYPQNPAR